MQLSPEVQKTIAMRKAEGRTHAQIATELSLLESDVDNFVFDWKIRGKSTASELSLGEKLYMEIIGKHAK